jgi:hypothetical protein
MLGFFLCSGFGAVSSGTLWCCGSGFTLQSFLLRRKGFSLQSASRWAVEFQLGFEAVVWIKNSLDLWGEAVIFEA